MTMAGPLESLRAYLRESGKGPRWKPARGVVVVGAGKGGVGTSTLAALLALAAEKEGRKVLLVDGDEGVGTLHHLFGIADPGPGIGALREGMLQMGDLLIPLGGGLDLLPAGGWAVEATLASFPGERRALFRRIASLYAAYDMTVVDGGSHLVSVAAACAPGAERLLAVTPPHRVAMAAAYALFKVVRERFPPLAVQVLVNAADPETGEAVFGTMAEACRRFLGVGIGFAGSVPTDPLLDATSGPIADLRAFPTSSPAFRAVQGLLALLEAEKPAGHHPVNPSDLAPAEGENRPGRAVPPTI